MSLESNHRDRLFARRRARGRATGELRESADEDDINADLDGCGREGGYGDEDNGEHAMPVRDFVWMTRLSAAFADVTKDGPAALLTAAPAPSGDKDDVTVWPLKRMSPGALVVAKIDGREKTCRVLKYHPEGVATGGGKFDMRGLNTVATVSTLAQTALRSVRRQHLLRARRHHAGRSELSLREFPADRRDPCARADRGRGRSFEAQGASKSRAATSALSASPARRCQTSWHSPPLPVRL